MREAQQLPRNAYNARKVPRVNLRYPFMELMSHQEKGAEWLQDAPNLMLGWDMGVGKTATILRGWWKTGAADPLLVLCLASARENWAREAARWVPDAGVQVLQTMRDRVDPFADIVITNYEKVLRKHVLESLTRNRWGAVCFDEAHMLANPDAKRTVAIYGRDDRWAKQRIPLISRTDRVWCATGTPTPNHPGELYSHARALWPDRIQYRGHTMERWEFEAAYCDIANTSRGPKIIGARNMAELHAKLDPVISRVRRKDVLDLPPIRIDSWPLDAETTNTFKMPPLVEGREIFGSLVARYGDISQLDVCASQILEIYLTCIRQNAPVIAAERQQVATLKAAVTAIMLAEEAEAAGATHEKTVVFAYHREAMAVLAKHLRKFGVVEIHGDVDPSARQGIIDRFQNEPALKFAILQIKAAGASVNIQAASNVVFTEYSWVPGDNEQAIARVYRHGQENPVYVRYAYLPGSVDELVGRAIARKMAMIW